jgi:predicted AAA+ superfamily ATPase
MIISDMFKNAYNDDRMPRNYFWRDHTGHEIDCLVERGGLLYPVEIKAGRTINQDFFKTLSWWNKIADISPDNSYVVYAGEERQKRSYGNVLPWSMTRIIGQEDR